MAAPTLQKMFGGVVPGGIITITPGTPIQITSNLKLATGDAGSGKSLTPPYSVTCRQIGISVDAAPSGEVYVNYGNFAGKGNQTALIVQSGTTQALPVNSRGCRGRDRRDEVVSGWVCRLRCGDFVCRREQLIK